MDIVADRGCLDRFEHSATLGKDNLVFALVLDRKPERLVLCEDSAVIGPFLVSSNEMLRHRYLDLHVAHDTDDGDPGVVDSRERSGDILVEGRTVVGDKPDVVADMHRGGLVVVVVVVVSVCCRIRRMVDSVKVRSLDEHACTAVTLPFDVEGLCRYGIQRFGHGDCENVRLAGIAHVDTSPGRLQDDGRTLVGERSRVVVEEASQRALPRQDKAASVAAAVGGVLEHAIRDRDADDGILVLHLLGDFGCCRDERGVDGDRACGHVHHRLLADGLDHLALYEFARRGVKLLDRGVNRVRDIDRLAEGPFLGGPGSLRGVRVDHVGSLFDQVAQERVEVPAALRHGERLVDVRVAPVDVDGVEHVLGAQELRELDVDHVGLAVAGRVDDGGIACRHRTHGFRDGDGAVAGGQLVAD